MGGGIGKRRARARDNSNEVLLTQGRSFGGAGESGAAAPDNRVQGAAKLIFEMKKIVFCLQQIFNF